MAQTPKTKQRNGLEPQGHIEGAAGNVQYPQEPKVPNQNLGERQDNYHKAAEQLQNERQNEEERHEPIEKTKEQKQVMIDPQERNDQQNYHFQDGGHQQAGQRPIAGTTMATAWSAGKRTCFCATTKPPGQQ